MTEFRFFRATAGLSVADIAALTGAKPHTGADLDRRLTGIAPIEGAEPSDVAFVKDMKFARALASTRAGAVLTSERFARHAPGNVAVLCVDKPYDAFVAVARHLYRPALRPTSVFGTVGVAPNAAVHPTAELADGVTIDPFAVVGPSVEIGSGSLIGSHAVIGEGPGSGEIARSVPIAPSRMPVLATASSSIPAVTSARTASVTSRAAMVMSRSRKSAASSSATTSRSGRERESIAAACATR